MAKAHVDFGTQAGASERRRAARRGVAWPAVLHGVGLVRSAKCIDVSSGGVALEIERRGVGEVPTVGSEILLVLQPTESEQVVVSALVVRAHESALGLRLHELSQAALRWLHGSALEAHGTAG